MSRTFRRKANENLKKKKKGFWSGKSLQASRNWFLLTVSSILGLNLDCNFAVNLPAAASTAASSSLKSKTERSFCDEPLITGPRCTPTDRPSDARKPQKLSSLVDLSGAESEQKSSAEDQRNCLTNGPSRFNEP